MNSLYYWLILKSELKPHKIGPGNNKKNNITPVFHFDSIVGTHSIAFVLLLEFRL